MTKTELKQGLSNFLEYYVNKKRAEYNYSIKKNELENQYNKFGSGLLEKWIEKRNIVFTYKLENMKKFTIKDVNQLFYELDDEMSIDGNMITKEKIVEGIKSELPQEAVEYMNFKKCESAIKKCTDEINCIKYKNQKYIKRMMNNFYMSFITMTIGYALVATFLLLYYKDIISSDDIMNVVITGGFILVFFAMAALIAYTIKYTNRKVDSFVSQSINEYNQAYLKIKDVVNKEVIASYINNELKEEYERELAKIEKSYQDEVREIQNKYNQCLVKLPYEIEVMYSKLDREEQDLFVTLAGNAESERDFSNIYVQCVNAKNSRKIYEEQKMQTAEARRQTWLAEQNAKEYEKQTRLIERQAEEQRAHMAEVERQNAELVKKQNEANKLAKENAEKQLDALNKSKDILYEMDYRERNK